MSFPSQTSGPQNKTLHVAGISPVVDELLLAEIFGAFGVVSSCRIVRDAAGVHGYCDFADYHSASAALAALNGREVLGSELKVTWNVQAAGPKEDTSGHPTVFVGNIGDSIDEYTLFEAFSQFNCSDSRIIRGEDGRCLGYGFVTIRTQEDAQAAVTAMDGQRLMGRPLRVSFAKTPRLSETTGTAASESTSRSRPPDTSQPLDPDVVAGQASETNNTVHVGNLLGTETEDMLRAAFQEYGQIENMRVPGKNFGFVQFATHAQAAAAIAARNGATPRGFSRPLRCTWASERRVPVAGAAGAPAPALPAIPPPPPPPPPAGYGYPPYPAPYPQNYMPPGPPPGNYPGFSGPGYPAPGYGGPPYMPQQYPPGGPHGFPPPPSSYPNHGPPHPNHGPPHHGPPHHGPPHHGPPRHDGDYNGDRRRDDRGMGDDKYGKMDKDSRGGGSRSHPYPR